MGPLVRGIREGGWLEIVNGSCPYSTYVSPTFGVPCYTSLLLGFLFFLRLPYLYSCSLKSCDHFAASSQYTPTPENLFGKVIFFHL